LETHFDYNETTTGATTATAATTAKLSRH